VSPYRFLVLEMAEVSPLCLPGRIIEWPLSDNMHHQWLLLAACFWVIFMFMVASKFITLTFKDPDGRYASWQSRFMANGVLPHHCSQAPRIEGSCPDQSGFQSHVIATKGRWEGKWLGRVPPDEVISSCLMPLGHL
jgi:hypothetical protein